jgi:phage terminase small subunit
MPKLLKLSNRQERFCVNYMLTHNASQSALDAGYSPKTAMVIGYENLHKPQILSRIKQLQETALPQQVAANVATAMVAERFKLLSDIARHPIEAPITAGHRTQAIQEMNKMEHLYSEQSSSDTNNVFNILVVDNETKELLSKVKQRTTKLLEG